ncbi:MAG: cupin domain-containing protein [Gaiellales bacterium]|nr:cupin domain-containing protein [Gaiellales bacterium]
MKIKKRSDVPSWETPGYPAVGKQVVLGPEDGSQEIVLRYFTVATGGSTPYHSHDFPHLVKIERGRGVAVDAEMEEEALSAGDYVYVPSGEVHCFKNTGTDALEFICIVPLRGEQAGSVASGVTP